MRILYFGTPDFAVPALQALCARGGVEVAAVVTQPDRPAGRGGSVTESPVKRAAGEHDLLVLQPERIRKEEERFFNALAPMAPFDLGVVAAFGQILPQGILDLPRAGCVNIHASLLPRWRGAAPIQRAILAGDSNSGVCLMRMEAGLDTGPVYAARSVAIEPDDDFGTLHDKLAHAGAALLEQHLDRIADGSLQPVPQPEEGVTYAKKIENAEALIDWSRSARQLALQVRAFSPVPGAYTKLGGKRLKIFKCCAKPGFVERGAPGRVVLADHELLHVQCGEGILALQELQLEGKRRMRSDEFLRGQPLTQGVVLGE